MNALAATTLATLLAWVIATVFGLLGGALALRSIRGRAVSLWFTEVRGGLPASVALAVLLSGTDWPSFCVVGTLVGFLQAAALARWMAASQERSSNALFAEVLRGRGAAFLVAKAAATRGAVRGVSATAPFQILLVEALGSTFSERTRATLGGLLVHGSGAEVLPALAFAFIFTVAAELLGSAWVLGGVLVRKRPG